MAVDFDLKGKHVIVTGSGRGIGRGMAEGFAAAGCKVVFMDINKENLDEAVKTNREKGYDVYGVCGDLSEVAEVDRMFDEGLEKLGGILDVMVTAAGVQHRDAPEDFPIEKFILIQKVNVVHVYRMAQRAIKVMLKQKGRGNGKIITVGSLGCFTVGHNISAYSASKGAVLQMTKALAEGVADRNINVNMIAPGYVNTELIKTLPPEKYNAIPDKIPMHRIAEIDDMVQPTLFFASSASDFITGTYLLVDGGQGAIH